MLHVAANGSDSKAGGPFATLERARDAVRDLKQREGGTLHEPVTILIHGGTYRLARPLVLTPEDSGTAECPVTYAAYRNEKPVISGGRLITGWKQVTVNGRKLWAADAGESYFHELWVNGRRRTRARAPNEGFFRISGLPDLKSGADYRTGQDRFQFAPGEISQWNNIEDVEVVLMTRWLAARLAIAAIDEEQHIVKLSRRSTQSMTEAFGPKPVYARYYVENALELLDAPGEWYLDRKTHTVYYMPAAGERMEKAEAVAPVLDQLLYLEGKPAEGRFVEHVTFRGLSFAHTGWWLPRDPQKAVPFQLQGAVMIPAAIQVDGGRHVCFELCKVAHVSNYGIHFSGGCEQDRIAGCELSDLGAGGIKIGEPLRNNQIRDDAAALTHDIEITDNHIYDGGKAFHQGHGIWVGQAFKTHIAHNHIHDFYYSGISVGWTWGYGKSLARDNVIEFNHVHDIGKGWLSDMGAIYTLGTQPGTIIRNNLFHDIECAAYAGRGIYLDEGSSGIIVENNVVYRTSTGGFAQNYGRDNIIRNNIFAFSREGQIEPAGNMSKARGLPQSHIFERNIIYWTPGTNLMRGDLKAKDVVLRDNLYWRTDGGEFKAGSQTWAQWQGRGEDKGSLIADPLFVNAAKYDFRLKPQSPALKLGFQPFDLSTVGPRPEVLRKMSH